MLQKLRLAEGVGALAGGLGDGGRQGQGCEADEAQHGSGGLHGNGRA